MKRSAIILSLIIIILISSILFIYFYFNRSWQHAFLIKPMYDLNTNEKIAALTFDDGPSSKKTEAVLKLLEQYDIKATFFMLGENIKKYDSIAKEVLSKGHLAGNHSYDHPRLYLKTPGFIKNEIDKTEELIKNLGQKEVKYFRPPYCSKMFLLPIILNEKKKILVTATYDSMIDYKTIIDFESVKNDITKNIHPGNIIVMHDGNNNDIKKTIMVLEFIINEYKNNGYRFVRLDY